MPFFSSDYKYHNYILLSILLGIIGFSFTYFIIFLNTTPDYSFYNSPTEAKATTPTYTFSKDSINLVEDAYLLSVSKFENIKKVPITDTAPEKGMFYIKSDFSETYLFTSTEKKELYFTIKTLDFKYAKTLGNKKFSPPYFFNKFPKAGLWIILISIATGFSFFLIPFFIAGIRKYSTELHSSVIVRNTIFATLMISILISAQFLPDRWSPFMLFKPTYITSYFGFGYEPWTLIYAATASFVSVLVWMILIFTINARLTFLLKTDKVVLLKNFNAIRKDVEVYFIIVGIFLAFTIFCTDTLLRAINSFIGSDVTVFPSEFAFMNGLVQTFFLILIYAGIRMSFSRIQQVIDLDENISATDKETLTEDKSFSNYLKVILTMLAPIIGSGLQEFITLISNVG